MTLMEQFDSELTRVRIVLATMIAAFAFLGVVLWRVQVVNVSKYKVRLDGQSMRRVRLPGARGRIFDRNGVCLADNRPSYCMAVYMEELRQPGRWSNTVDEVERGIDRLSDVLGLKKQVTRDDITKHINRLPLPFVAWKDVDQATLARWAESGVLFPGVDVYVEPVRFYPLGACAAHVLGYVGRSNLRERSEEPYSFYFYLPEMEGKFGVEKGLNESLTGTAGGRLIRVDAVGFKHEDIQMDELKAVPGSDVTLTVDTRIQRLVEEALSGETGAAVVLDPRNGDVLAMASSPSFDPNSFSPSVSMAELSRLSSDEGKPFFNRAISGTYPPGSAFKPIVAIAALENRIATGGTKFHCPGYFDLADVRFHCWSKRGHGWLGMRKALEQSCNSYFCQLGLKCGYDRIFHMAGAVGFGRKTGTDLPFESGGLLPDNTWKIRKYNDAWRGGDTCNVSIGQGALLVTPLQMAVFTAAIANGGYVYRPRLVIGSAERKGELVNRMGWSAETIKVVRGAMCDVIHAQSGTGKRARIAGIKMGGKTGTAEYGLESEHKKHAWMIVFAPFDQPRYAVSMVIEEAVSGGVTAAPRIKTLMEGIFRLE